MGNVWDWLLQGTGITPEQLIQHGSGTSVSQPRADGSSFIKLDDLPIAAEEIRTGTTPVQVAERESRKAKDRLRRHQKRQKGMSQVRAAASGVKGASVNQYLNLLQDIMDTQFARVERGESDEFVPFDKAQFQGFLVQARNLLAPWYGKIWR